MSHSRFDKTCKICGTHYKYCGTCKDYSDLPRWMESYCSENCRTIFNTIMSYRAAYQTPDECKAALLACDLSKRESFDSDINAFISAILADEDKPVETPAAAAAEGHQDAQESVPEPEDGIVVEKTKSSRKSKK